MARQASAAVRIPVAQQAEIVRASEKDRQVCDELAQVILDLWRSGATLLRPLSRLSRGRFVRQRQARSTLSTAAARQVQTSLPAVVQRLLAQQASADQTEQWEPLGSAPSLHQVVADLLFFWSTIGSGRQTPGEEYCDLFECTYVSGERSRIEPLSWRQRAVQILVYAGLRARQLLLYWLRYALRSMDRQLRQRAVFGRALSAETRSRLQRYFRLFDTWLVRCFAAELGDRPSIAFWLQWLARLHLALFYLSGRYYEVAKRLARVRLVHIGRSRAYSPRYDALGLVIVLQLIFEPIDMLLQRPSWRQGLRSFFMSTVAILRQLRDIICSRTGQLIGQQSNEADLFKAGTLSEASHSERTGTRSVSSVGVATGKPPLVGRQRAEPSVTENEQTGARHRCVLCLDRCRDPTCAACGHVFCWVCILDWVRQQHSCPVCRSAARLTDLVCLSGLG
jgi:peroxin-10